ncbi:MAG: SUMF1/EgtB/PvdO family nonheme iron enzyme [Nitrospinaceae bacterium]
MRNHIIPLLSLYFLMNTVPAFGAEGPPEGMALVKGGCFTMGTDKTYYYEVGRKNDREKPPHKVCLESFYLDKHETIQEKWEAEMEFNRSVFQKPDLPVNRINWREANTYCRKIGHRLPTEAEWEYAARAGSKAENPWGDGIDGDYLWYLDNSFRRQPPIGKKKPNAWGLYDMMGSVWEWVADWYSDSYYQDSPVNNPKGPLTRQSWRVIRGASWVDEEKDIHVTIRHRGNAEDTTDFWVGVRCAHTAGK